MKIDIVYMWVDGNDPAWRVKRDSYLPNKERHQDKQTFSEARTIDNDELKYSLRSVEMYAPWINHLYIITDNQIPEWLDTDNEKITIVDHKEILPKEVLPTFNSTVIELGLTKIPNLSEHFILANDDMMFNRPVSKEFFFTKDGKPIYRLKKISTIYRWLKTKKNGGHIEETTYDKTISKASQIIYRDYKKSYKTLKPAHGIDPYLKSSIKECMKVYQKEVDSAILNRFRTSQDVQRHLFTLYSFATNKAKYTISSSSLISILHKLDFMDIKPYKILYIELTDKKMLDKIRRLRPSILCLNDTENSTKEDRDRTKCIMKTLYPNKSIFEK